MTSETTCVDTNECWETPLLFSSICIILSYRLAVWLQQQASNLFFHTTNTLSLFTLHYGLSPLWTTTATGYTLDIQYHHCWLQSQRSRVLDWNHCESSLYSMAVVGSPSWPRKYIDHPYKVQAQDTTYSSLLQWIGTTAWPFIDNVGWRLYTSFASVSSAKVRSSGSVAESLLVVPATRQRVANTRYQNPTMARPYSWSWTSPTKWRATWICREWSWGR